MTVREIKMQIFKFFRPLIEAPNLSNGKNGGKDPKKFMSNEKIIEEEFKFFFENKDSANGGSFEADNPLYAIFINNNLPSE